MADQHYLGLLKQGVNAWNIWRKDHPEIRPNLSDANLVRANLNWADLTGADLSRVSLNGANLNWADLTGADLSWADLSRAYLSGAELSGATVGATTFGNVDLREVKGLETVTHSFPSSIGIDTLYRSEGHIPEGFLREAGVPAILLDYLPSLLSQPIQYYTCSISVRLVSPKPAKVGGWAGKEYSFHN
ncbi:MAG TPA: pentapeptide repeat-containing protein [Ktedonobacteraceae bacterium]|nr:pentapeptide repeat-containing protein [Ktedonobacteraceae bacterium]